MNNKRTSLHDSSIGESCIPHSQITTNSYQDLHNPHSRFINLGQSWNKEFSPIPKNSPKNGNYLTYSTSKLPLNYKRYPSEPPLKEDIVPAPTDTHHVIMNKMRNKTTTDYDSSIYREFLDGMVRRRERIGMSYVGLPPKEYTMRNYASCANMSSSVSPEESFDSSSTESLKDTDQAFIPHHIKSQSHRESPDKIRTQVGIAVTRLKSNGTSKQLNGGIFTVSDSNKVAESDGFGELTTATNNKPKEPTISQNHVEASKYDDENHYYIIKKGDQIADRYEMLAPLGEGSFGSVVKVYDHDTKRKLAIKIIRSDAKSSKQAIEEIKILNKLKIESNSESIIQFIGSFEFRNHCCMVFELLDMNLFQLIENRRYRGISQRRTARITSIILNCLEILESQKIVHCDLKPENILLVPTNPDAVKVIDFGSSCFIDEQVYSYIQSRFYRAPEIILGNTPYNCAIDMWSLGCIVAEMIMGTPLFPGQTEGEMMIMIMEILGLPNLSMIRRSDRGRKYFNEDGEPRYLGRQRLRTNPHLTAYSTVTMHNSSATGGIHSTTPGTLDLSTALCKPRTSSVVEVATESAELTKVTTQREPLDPDMVDFIEKCLKWEPQRRFKAKHALKHAWIVKHNPRKQSLDENGAVSIKVVDKPIKVNNTRVPISPSNGTEAAKLLNLDGFSPRLREEMKAIRIRNHMQPAESSKSECRITFSGEKSSPQPSSVSPQKTTYRHSYVSQSLHPQVSDKHKSTTTNRIELSPTSTSILGNKTSNYSISNNKYYSALLNPSPSHSQRYSPATSSDLNSTTLHYPTSQFSHSRSQSNVVPIRPVNNSYLVTGPHSTHNRSSAVLVNDSKSSLRSAVSLMPTQYSTTTTPPTLSSSSRMKVGNASNITRGLYDYSATRHGHPRRNTFVGQPSSTKFYSLVGNAPATSTTTTEQRTRRGVSAEHTGTSFINKPKYLYSEQPWNYSLR